MSRVDDLLRRFTEGECDSLFRLREDGPAIWAQFFGKAPHSAKLYRLAAKGSRGVRLQTVEDGGRALFCTRRWVAEFLVAASDARGTAPPLAKHQPRRKRGRAMPRARESGGAA